MSTQLGNEPLVERWRGTDAYLYDRTPLE
jgi:hypothetical protein